MVEIQIDPSEDIWEVPEPYWRRKPFVFLISLVLFVVLFTFLCLGLMTINSSSSSSSSWDGYPEWAKNAVFTPSEMDGCVVDRDEAVICWRYEKEKEKKGEKGEGEVVLGVVVEEGEGEGWVGTWVGLGISDNGGMIGADIVTFSTELGIQDRFSTQFQRPSLDNDNVTNIQLLKGGTTGKTLSFTFKRAVKVCEEGKEKDLDIGEGGVNVVWATGGVVGRDIGYHGKRKGTVVVDLLGGGEGMGWNENREDVEPFQFLMSDKNNNPISLLEFATEKDTYLRKMFQADFFDEKQHILEIYAIVDNLDHVHHMTLFHCVDVRVGNETGYGFGDPTSIDAVNECVEVVGLWAVGGEKLFRFPENVGFPVGVAGQVDYFKVEIHYNMQSSEGKTTDNSGFEIRVGKPQKQEAGVMFFGWDINPQSFVLPPGEKEVKREVYFPEKVLNRLPGGEEEGEGGVIVFKSLVHMHRYGRKGVAQHYRGGKEIEPMRGKEYYDFNSQRMDDQQLRVMPGDAMKFTCYYDTTGTTEPVMGGEGTENEMCFYFMFYYPRVEEEMQVVTLMEQVDQQLLFTGMEGDQPGLMWLNKTQFDSQEAYVPPTRQKCEMVEGGNDSGEKDSEGEGNDGDSEGEENGSEGEEGDGDSDGKGDDY